MELRQLSIPEAEILDLTLEIIGEGYTADEASRLALSAMPSPDPEFATWLKEAR